MLYSCTHVAPLGIKGLICSEISAGFAVYSFGQDFLNWS